MSDTRRYEDKLVGKLVRIWPLIVGVVLVILAFGSIQTKIVYIEKDAQESKVRIDNHEGLLYQHAEALRMLPEMRADIKSLLKETRRDRSDRQDH